MAKSGKRQCFPSIRSKYEIGSNPKSTSKDTFKI